MRTPFANVAFVLFLRRFLWIATESKGGAYVAWRLCLDDWQFPGNNERHKVIANLLLINDLYQLEHLRDAPDLTEWIDFACLLADEAAAMRNLILDLNQSLVEDRYCYFDMSLHMCASVFAGRWNALECRV